LIFDLICCVILSVVIFKEVNLVNREVWVDKNLTSQRSLSRKLLKEAHEEASRGSRLMKLLKEVT